MKYFLIAVLTTFMFSRGALAAPTPNSSPKPQLKIINGRPVRERSSPFVRIILSTAGGSRSLCSGTMLTSTAVLTAAHCFLLEPVTRAVVEVGRASVNARRVVIDPNIALDPNATSLFNDDAIVFLARPIRTSVMPILTSRALQGGDTFSIYGYGLTSSGSVNMLTTAEMTANVVANGQIEATFSGVGGNTCNGDSGGPAVFRATSGGRRVRGVVGVTSTGSTEGCQPGDQSVFTSTQGGTVLRFIRKTVPEVKEN